MRHHGSTGGIAVRPRNAARTALAMTTPGTRNRTRGEGRSSGLNVTLHAMSLNVPETPGHPNKLPFKGILTRIDEPSDAAPDGSNGKRVLLTRAAAEAPSPRCWECPWTPRRIWAATT